MMFVVRWVFVCLLFDSLRLSLFGLLGVRVKLFAVRC